MPTTQECQAEMKDDMNFLQGKDLSGDDYVGRSEAPSINEDKKNFWFMHTEIGSF